jgi:hypothetical protein
VYNINVLGNYSSDVVALITVANSQCLGEEKREKKKEGVNLEKLKTVIGLHEWYLRSSEKTAVSVYRAHFRRTVSIEYRSGVPHIL